MKAFYVAVACLLLAACGGNKEVIYFDTDDGPRSKDLVKTLPDDLQGDEQNRRYSSFPLVQEELAAEGAR